MKEAITLKPSAEFLEECHNVAKLCIMSGNNNNAERAIYLVN